MKFKTTIDKDSKVPLHYQIYQDLFKKIEDGIYKVDEKLPSEPALQQTYDVSRMTIRTAVQELEKQGLVKKLRGIGTVICEQQREFNLKKLTSFSHDSDIYGEESSSILRSFSVIEADEEISKALKLEPGEKVYYIERIRLRDNLIIGLHKAYIRAIGGLELKKEDFTPQSSLYKLIENKGINIVTAEEDLEARMVTAEIATTLQMKRRQPIFYKERVTYTDNSVPFEYVEMFYRADAYKYKVTLDFRE